MFYSVRSGCIFAKVVLFGQKLLCSGKSVCIREKWMHSNKSGCIREKISVVGEMVLF